MTAILKYLRAHWRGEHTLPRAFWLNFLLPFAAVAGLETYFATPFVTSPTMFAALAGGCFLLFRVLLYPWQVIGLLRTCDRYLSSYGDPLWVRGIYCTLVLSLVLALASSFTTLQTGLSLYEQNRRPPPRVATSPAYELSLDTDDWVHLEGELAPGVTNALRAFLVEHPGVIGVDLSSIGGRVYEARGLASVIAQGQLRTRVSTTCNSACTLAFLAGRKRTVLAGAEMGFHGYRLEIANPFMNVADEEEQDRAYFRSRRVADTFVATAFSTQPDTMWFPSLDELLEAGVVHEVRQTR